MVLVAISLALSVLSLPVVHAEPRDGLSSNALSIAQVGALARAIDKTRDGGYIEAGRGFGGWVMKTTANGQTEWDNYYTLAGYTYVEFDSVHETRDGGYILAGAAVSLHFTTGSDGLLVKLDRHGLVQWSKTYGGPKDDGFLMAQQTLDGGYIAIGNTEMIGPHASNGWVVKLDRLGNREWEETFAGQDVYSVGLTRDGGYVLSGAVEFLPGNPGVWLFKLNSKGAVLWQLGFDATGDKYPAAIRESSSVQTRDGGYLLAAEVDTGQFASSSRLLIVRLDSERNILWQEWYGSGTDMSPYISLVETRDRGALVSGGSTGPYLLKLRANGELSWQRVYGRQDEVFWQAIEARDGGFVVAGVLSPQGPRGVEGAWLLKTDREGRTLGCPPSELPLSAPLVATISNVFNPTVSSTVTQATTIETNASTTIVAIPASIMCMTALVMSDDKDDDMKSNEPFRS